MKLLKSLGLTLLTVALCLVCFAGCKDKGVEGTYKFVSSTYTSTVNGQTETEEMKVGDLPYEGATEAERLTADYQVITLNKDGTLTMSMKMGENSESMSGTWKKGDNANEYVLTIVEEPTGSVDPSAEPDAESVTAVIKDGTMTIAQSETTANYSYSSTLILKK